MKKKSIRIIVLAVVLTGCGIYCSIRWRAWFANPPEPRWDGDTLNYRFYCFGEDSVPGFRSCSNGWQDVNMPEQLDILLLGDVHNSISNEQWRMLTYRHPYVDCYAQLGDWVERNYFYYFQLLAQQMDGASIQRLPVINIPGNHEYRKGLKRVLLDNWQQTFKHPQNGPVDFLGTSYYIDFPNLRFIAINTNGLQLLQDYTRVQTWLKKSIKEAKGRFTVVMMHHPVYSCGMGRQNIPIWLFFSKVLSKADIVFAGHDHNYARRLPFVNTNSATKFYLNQLNDADERVACGVQLYNLLAVKTDTMTLQTMLMDSGEEYDKVQIIKSANGRQIIDYYRDNKDELILLPDRYQHKKKSRKVKTFLQRRQKRIQSKERHQGDRSENGKDTLKKI